ncbi:MAG TPA: restriction endonuclease subunit S [Bacteroidales bacterium]|nr:restriction endonuclease subunit S [Bacteroidales bacterium]
MELKKGYKQTEIGVIPEDWEVKEIGSIINYTKGFAFKSREYKNYGIRVIRVSDTLFDTIKKENAIYVDKNDSEKYKNWKLKKNDLIISTVGSKPPMYDSMVGKVIRITEENEGSLLNQNAVLIRSKDKLKENQGLLFYNLKTENYINHIELIFRGNANQASITLKDLFEYKLPIPPTQEEQTAIANALTDIDDLINALETKIEKKKNLKQGAMQELLKPKEGWVEKRLGEIGETYGGLTGKSKAHFGQGNAYYIPFMNILSNPIIDINNFEKVSVGEKEKQNKVIAGDLFFNTSSETPEEVGICSVIIEEVENLYLNSFCFGFRLKDNEVSGLYLSYFFRSKIGRELMTSLAQGATRYNLSKSLFNQLKITLPQSIEGQNRITNILFDMDKEIEGLEGELEKYRMMKDGMMKDLLTGRIRLI